MSYFVIQTRHKDSTTVIQIRQYNYANYCHMLTEKKRQKIKKLFSEVNVLEICTELNVSRATIYRVLNGRHKCQPKAVNDLKAVVDRAKKERKKTLNNISSL